MILDKYGRRFVVPFVCVRDACDVRLSGQTVSMRVQNVCFRPMTTPDGRSVTISTSSSHFAFNLFKKLKFICGIAVKIEFITWNWRVFVRENSTCEKSNFRRKTAKTTQQAYAFPFPSGFYAKINVEALALNLQLSKCTRMQNIILYAKASELVGARECVFAFNAQFAPIHFPPTCTE